MVQHVTVKIASGSALSEAINLDKIDNTPAGLRLFAIIMPAAWTAANLTFQVSVDGGTTYQNLYDDSGVEIVCVSSASTTIVFRDPTIFSSIALLKVRSGTAATPVNQGGDRNIGLVLRAI